jgi:Methylase involved in ubiquinone/menaquinone biosynthesis
VPRARIVAVDASAGMLARARAKPWPATVEFAHGRVEDLTGEPFDGIFAAYLIRNLPDPGTAVGTLFSLLRPGGSLVVHDYSVRDSPFTRLVWHTVCWTVIIPAGWVMTGDAGLYRYLWRSALDFDRPGAFTDRLRRAGFADVGAATMTGWQRGIVYTFRGRRP